MRLRRRIEFSMTDIKEALSEWMKKDVNGGFSVQDVQFGQGFVPPPDGVHCYVDLQTEPQPPPEPLYPLRSEIFFGSTYDRSDALSGPNRFKYYCDGTSICWPNGQFVCDRDQLRDEKSPGSGD